MDQSFPSSDQGAFVQVNGLRMYYESHGEGIPVILLHGGLETCRMVLGLDRPFVAGYSDGARLPSTWRSTILAWQEDI